MSHRTCKDCHDSERMKELKDTEKVVMTRWDADKGKVTHTTGVIPFVPDKFEFQFVTLDGEDWIPLTKAVGRMQHEFCAPLTKKQLKSLGAAQYSVGPQNRNSFHRTAPNRRISCKASRHEESTLLSERLQIGTPP